MEYENLVDYLSILIDMEKNIYIQKNTLGIMRSKQKTLGIAKKLDYPTHYSANPEYGVYMLKAGVVCAALGFIVDIFMNWSRFWESDGIFAVILVLLHGILPGLGVGIVGGLIIGTIIGSIKGKEEQKELDASFEYELEHFKKIESIENERLNNENAICKSLQANIEMLDKKYRESQERLKEFYDYNVIMPKYRYDIVAISSFYQYLIEKRTYCLEFDRATGDRGAYNIYNEELQRGMIISQLNVVIDKLDQVIDNQRTLQITLQDANQKINYLSDRVDRQTKQLNSSIQEQTAIQTYNAERVEAELRFMNTMNILNHINRR